MNPNLEALRQACEELGIVYEVPAENPIIVKVKGKYFIHCTTPLNSASVSKIFKDKSLTHMVLKDVVNQPKTMQFVDPEVSQEYSDYVEYNSIDAITTKIMKDFVLPVVIKMNSGERRRNLHFCSNKKSLENAIQCIFNKNSRDYDYIALVQEMISYRKEYRVIVLNGKIELVYEKKSFKENNDLQLQDRLQSFINPMFSTLDFEYGGLDIAELDDGSFVLFEANTASRFAPYIKKNGYEKIVSIYKKILELI